jgi:hypothetical protein
VWWPFFRGRNGKTQITDHAVLTKINGIGRFGAKILESGLMIVVRKSFKMDKAS